MIPCMRMNLIARHSGNSEEGAAIVALALTLRPACGLPGDYQFKTTSTSLMKMLRKGTELSLDTLAGFEGQVLSCPFARLMGIEMSEAILTEIGYFVD
jgi:hypothetical protein